MSTKTKNDKTNTNLTELAQQAGVVLMTVAATVGLLELPEHPNSRIVVPNQPSLVTVGVNSESNNPLRREREETAPHHISYSEIQRTPGRTGKF
jgi:hypothetical protein